jgi:hypothetical protein
MRWLRLLPWVGALWMLGALVEAFAGRPITAVLAFAIAVSLLYIWRDLSDRERERLQQEDRRRRYAE